MPETAFRRAVRGRRIEREQLRDVVVAYDLLAAPEENRFVHVVPVMMPRHGGVAWIAADAYVRHALVLRQAVERRVGFDESAVPLRAQQSEHVLAAFHAHVEPWGHFRERTRRSRLLEDQQRADHLRPGGAALGRS